MFLRYHAHKNEKDRRIGHIVIGYISWGVTLKWEDISHWSEKLTCKAESNPNFYLCPVGWQQYAFVACNLPDIQKKKEEAFPAAAG